MDYIILQFGEACTVFAPNSDAAVVLINWISDGFLTTAEALKALTKVAPEYTGEMPEIVDNILEVCGLADDAEVS